MAAELSMLGPPESEAAPGRDCRQMTGKQEGTELLRVCRRHGSYRVVAQVEMLHELKISSALLPGSPFQ